MTNSMTAFARNQAEFPWGSLIWEIRSVNHRYLEPAFRLPEQFRQIETGLRDILRSTISRGKIDAQLKFLPDVSDGNQIPINESLLEQLNQAIQKIGTVTGSTDTSPLELLKWPGIIQEKGQESKVIEEESLSLFKSTLALLVEHRAREGSELKLAVENRLDGITTIVNDIVCLTYLPHKRTNYKSKSVILRQKLTRIALSKNWC